MSTDVRRAAVLASALAVFLLAAPSDKKQPEENPNVFPADYKNEILLTMTSSLEDPTNIRSAYISDPVLRPAGKEERYVVCVRSDFRATRTRTTPASRIASVISIAAISTSWWMLQRNSAADTAYKPFPELEKLCQAKKCD